MNDYGLKVVYLERRDVFKHMFVRYSYNRSRVMYVYVYRVYVFIWIESAPEPFRRKYSVWSFLKLMAVEVTLECDWSSDVTPPEILSCSYRVNVSAVNVRRCL